MKQGRRYRRFAQFLVLSALCACLGDNVTAPLIGAPKAEGLTRNDSLAVMALAEQWGVATAGFRMALVRLHARHGDSLAAVNSEHADVIKGMLARSVSDSATAVNGERSARLRQHSGARFYYTGGSGPGIIRPDLSVTQFWLPNNPEIYVNTAVSLPAFYIKNRTTGSYVKFGQTYGIVSSQKIDFQPPDAPNQPIPFIPYLTTPPDFIPLQVDCTHFGIEGSATTTHEAGWMLVDVGIVGGTYTSSDTDRGACPHVAPTAHFHMTGGGAAGSDMSALEMTAPAWVSIDASGSERDAPIVSYDWMLALYERQIGFSIGTYADYGPTGVSLTETDALGKTAIADGVIYVSDAALPPPPPPGGGGGGGGGGAGGCTYWEISYDDGLTWQYLTTTCP